MILHGIARRTSTPFPDSQISSLHKYQTQALDPALHAIEARIYAEDPSANFVPCPGTLQYVSFPTQDWIRVDTWVTTGTEVTPFFDPLLAKIIVWGATRNEAVQRLGKALNDTRVCGSSCNVGYLREVVLSSVFRDGAATTQWLETFEYAPQYVMHLARCF
jgi:urea carboxylase